MAIENNIKKDDFILHLDGRSYGSGATVNYSIRIVKTNKTISIYLHSKRYAYILNSSGIHILRKDDKTKIFYLSDKENEYILNLKNKLKSKQKLFSKDMYILSENIDNFSIQTKNHVVKGIIYDNEYTNIIKDIVYFVMKKYGKDLDFLTRKGGAYVVK
jgi:hypothetical protein